MAGDDWLPRELAELQRKDQWRTLDARVVTARTGRTVDVGGRTLLCFASNDYLGLSADPTVLEQAAALVRSLGTGAGASRHISGNLAIHRQLEERLARWQQTDGALLFGSGYLANVGVIAALVGQGDHVFSDALNHASLIDGCRQSRAHVHVYRHTDANHLDSLLAAHAGPGRRLVVTDGVFSMDGDVAPLVPICDVAEKHGAMVLVDEAHAVGVLGQQGRGACHAAGVQERVTVRMGTLGKALGSYGAFVVGGTHIMAWLANTARTLVFSTALPAFSAAAALVALERVEDGALTERLEQHQRALATLLAERGLDPWLPETLRGPRGLGTPVVPLLLGSNAAALHAAEFLKDRGVLVVGIRPPTVPEGSARLRVTLSAAHTSQDVLQLVDALDGALT